MNADARPRVWLRTCPSTATHAVANSVRTGHGFTVASFITQLCVVITGLFGLQLGQLLIQNTQAHANYTVPPKRH